MDARSRRRPSSTSTFSVVERRTKIAATPDAEKGRQNDDYEMFRRKPRGYPLDRIMAPDTIAEIFVTTF